MTANSSLKEEEEVTGAETGSSPKRQKKLKVERMEENPPDRRRVRTRERHTKSM
jgi:hypothetical protein